MSVSENHTTTTTKVLNDLVNKVLLAESSQQKKECLRIPPDLPERRKEFTIGISNGEKCPCSDCLVTWLWTQEFSLAELSELLKDFQKIHPKSVKMVHVEYNLISCRGIHAPEWFKYLKQKYPTCRICKLI